MLTTYIGVQHLLRVELVKSFGPSSNHLSVTLLTSTQASTNHCLASVPTEKFDTEGGCYKVYINNDIGTVNNDFFFYIGRTSCGNGTELQP